MGYDTNLKTTASRLARQMLPLAKNILECRNMPMLHPSPCILKGDAASIHVTILLWCRFLKVLKPGGRLLISDYCRAPGRPTPTFAEYIKQRGYDLHSVEDYGAMLQGAGFQAVKAEDRTWQVRPKIWTYQATVSDIYP